MFFEEYLYKTLNGKAVVGDSLKLLQNIPNESINLVITSPPFALQRQKEYGNKSQSEYIHWLLQFTYEVKRVLTDDGSFVLDLGGAYEKGVPVRSLYNFKFLIEACEKQNWRLAEEFFWFNPAKLPSPIEWVNKRKIRVKDAVNTIWWLSKNEFPKANVSNVLTEYSDRMKKLIQDQEKFYKPNKRPSGHDISMGFGRDNGGAIPSNLLQIPNTESTSQYMSLCKEYNLQSHPARFPAKLPEFFIKYLTDPQDIVLDIFAGSNTTGWVAEKLNRRWLSFDCNHGYLAVSIFRFINRQRINDIFDQAQKSETAKIKIEPDPLLFPKEVFAKIL